MKLNKLKILVISLIASAVLTVVSGIPRFLWSSPGGSAYGSGFPLSYSIQYCGGYATCYWTTFSTISFLEDFFIYFVIALAILALLKFFYRPIKQ